AHYRAFEKDPPFDILHGFLRRNSCVDTPTNQPRLDFISRPLQALEDRASHHPVLVALREEAQLLGEMGNALAGRWPWGTSSSGRCPSSSAAGRRRRTHGASARSRRGMGRTRATCWEPPTS